MNISDLSSCGKPQAKNSRHILTESPFAYVAAGGLGILRMEYLDACFHPDPEPVL
jgi:hypothetical protein